MKLKVTLKLSHIIIVLFRPAATADILTIFDDNIKSFSALCRAALPYVDFFRDRKSAKWKLENPRKGSREAVARPGQNLHNVYSGGIVV